MDIQRTIYALADNLRDALAPARCIDCLEEGTWYCVACRRHTPPHVLQCIGCKQEQARGRTCNECREDISLHGFISARPYSDQYLQRGIEWMKFKGVRSLGEILAGLLVPKLPTIASIEDLSRTAILVPLPLHEKRLRSRGFNQSEDIARAIGTMCSIEVRHLLTRKAATASQARLPHDLRVQNMKDAFALTVSEQEYIEMTNIKPIIVIVDDVSTTGATLMSAAKTFPEAPNLQIWGAAVARG